MTYANPTTRTGTNGMAIAGLVCGIVGIFIASIILGPLAIVFGGVGLSRARAGGGGRGMAIAGVVLGVVDLVLGIVLLTMVAKNGGWHW